MTTNQNSHKINNRDHYDHLALSFEASTSFISNFSFVLTVQLGLQRNHHVIDDILFMSPLVL